MIMDLFCVKKNDVRMYDAILIIRFILLMINYKL
jgi:hypothetical protein